MAQVCLADPARRADPAPGGAASDEDPQRRRGRRRTKRGRGRRRRRSTRVRERSNSEGDMEGIPIATEEPVACGHEIATRSLWPVRVPPSPQGREGGGGGSRDEGG